MDWYEIIHQGKYPELPSLVDFIHKFRQDIDAYMAKNYKGLKYNFAQTNESDGENETGGNNSFSTLKCSKSNESDHSTERWFKTKTCGNCIVMEHIARYCKQEKKCGKSGQSLANCFIRRSLCNSPSHEAVTCNIYPGIELAQAACTKS